MKLFNWIRGLFGRKVAGSTPQVSSVAVNDAPKKKAVIRKPVDYSKSFAIFDLFRSPFRYTPRARRSRVVVGKIIRWMPGGRHVVYESNVGPVRKPLSQST